jgi:cytoskeletal protein CcmA (bactofilin family)
VAEELTVSGNVYTQKDLEVVGNVYVDGNVVAYKDLSVTGNAYVSGNVNVTKQLSVSGNAYISGNVEVTKSLIVSANTHLKGPNVFITNTMDFLNPNDCDCHRSGVKCPDPLGSVGECEQYRFKSTKRSGIIV